jgi:hypothetical protein
LLVLLQMFGGPAIALSATAGVATAAPAPASPDLRITDYRVIRLPARDQSGRLRLAIRSFKSDGVAHLLVVDPVSFQSLDLPAASLTLSTTAAEPSLGHTPFMRALQRYDAPPYPLQNGGATRADSRVGGEFLTVDLCPSKRPFERELFDTLALAGKGAPVPVAISISGVWLLNHSEELSYLRRESAAGRLAITWVNHSYHHSYDPKAPLARNFVLTPGTDFPGEVLELEQLLLSRGMVPSPFFRFPGLVSDAATVKRLREFSLIPIGSDAWLAKGESPRQGSFILVHGNGNEPKGVKLLLPMLRAGELHLLALPEAFDR